VSREREKSPRPDPASDPSDRNADRGSLPAEPPPPTPEELERLRTSAAERDEFLEKLQRTAAEFANYQKRVQRERSDAARYASQDFATRMLPVLDHLELAVRSAEKSREAGAGGKLLEGVKLVERQFEKALADNDVKPIDAEGQRFDPSLHEAISRQERTDVPEGTIVEVVRRGYKLHDRVIRPAQVIIAMRGEAAAGAGSDDRDTR